jgi:phage RecT family recombinase
MAENPVAVVCRTLVTPEMQQKFKAVLPPDVSLDRFTRVTLTAIQKNPAIIDCDRTTLYNACVDAANRGLMPDGREGAIVSFRQKDGPPRAQFMPMPEGVIKELAKAGVKAHSVSIYEKDTVEIWHDDDGQHFRHVPKVFGDRGERIGAVAWAKDAQGRTYVEAMNMDDLLRVAQVSRSKDKNGNIVGPWAQWPERMEQKSTLHRLRKRIAIIGADDVVDRLQEDEAADVATPDDDPPAPVSAPTAAPAATTKRPRGLQAVVDRAKAEDAVPAGGDDGDPGYSDDDIF